MTSTKLLNPGETAPEFEATNINGKTIRLADYRGKPVVLAFLRGFL
jgi:peroxiredoxin